VEWVEEAQGLLGVGSADLDPWQRQQAVSYLSHGFRRRHRQAMATLDELRPHLDSSAAEHLGCGADRLTWLWLTLHRLIRRGESGAEVRGLTGRLLEQLRSWLSECKLARQELESPAHDWNSEDGGQPMLAGMTIGGD
jgi:hypothetical protein